MSSKKRKRLLLKRIRLIFCITLFILTISGGFLLNGDISANANQTAEAGTGAQKTSTFLTGLWKRYNELRNGSVTNNSLKGNDPQNSSPRDGRAKNSGLAKLEQDINKLLSVQEGLYGVYYLNLKNGEEMDINADKAFTAASTIKIPLNLYLFERIDAGLIDPAGTLTYLEEDYEEGTGQIRYSSPGGKYSVKELSRLSIEVSDNVAANMLMRYLGKTEVKDYMRRVGGKVVEDDRNISSPKDMGLYMKLVYNSYTSGSQSGKELMNYFENTVYNDRIPAGLPKGVKTAHKIGTQVKVVNDVGIVLAAKPYILSVMSDGVDESKAPGVIADISGMVYNYVNSMK